MTSQRKHRTFTFYILIIVLLACNTKSDDPRPEETDYTALLTNQIDNVIIPSMIYYQSEMDDLLVQAELFIGTIDENSLNALREAYKKAYVAYQAAAVHNYYATLNKNLVNTTNLYPVDIDALDSFIENESYNFNTTSQERANGFPALDYLLYGQNDMIIYYNNDPKRGTFIVELIKAMKFTSDGLVEQWTGNLRDNFIGNGGTEIGSSISVQLNDVLLYYEENIRENKVGIPIGKLGPNDSPITADPAKIEGYYQSLNDDNDEFALLLVKEAVKEIEDIYLGKTFNGQDDKGYDDLLVAREQPSIDTDIKDQFEAIYYQIESRTSISGNTDLYDAVQSLVTLFKSDLFPVLNIQDADGANDGD